MMAATDLNFKFWACAETGFVINCLDKDDIDINIAMFNLGFHFPFLDFFNSFQSKSHNIFLI